MFKRIVRVGLVILLLATTLLVPHRAGACSCDLELFTAWHNADAIFLGTIVYVEEITERSLLYTFETHRIWKGVDSLQIQIESGSESAPCGAFFELEKTYVVYAYAYTRRGNLSSGLCDNHPASSLAPYRWKLSQLSGRIAEKLGLVPRASMN